MEPHRTLVVEVREGGLHERVVPRAAGPTDGTRTRDPPALKQPPLQLRREVLCLQVKSIEFSKENLVVKA